MCGNPLHAEDIHAECVPRLGKSHADAALSGAECSHYECFSLAFLHSRLAFFSESDSAPRALQFSSSQDLWENNSGQRIWAASDKRAHVGSMPACLAITAEGESIRPSSSLNMISVPPLWATWFRSVQVTARRSLSASWQMLSMSSGSNGLRWGAISQQAGGVFSHWALSEPHLHSLDAPTLRLDKRLQHCTLWLCSRSSRPRCTPVRKPVWMQLHSGTWGAWQTWLYASPKPPPRPSGIQCTAWKHIQFIRVQ